MKFWRRSRLGLWLTLAAADALAVNLVVASAFSASVDPQGNEICHATGNYAPANDAGTPIGNQPFKCPICVAGHFNTALLSSQPAVWFRATFAGLAEYFAAAGPARPAVLSKPPARGPPTAA